MNVLPLKKIFHKTSVLYIIKIILLSKQNTDIKFDKFLIVPTINKKLTQFTNLLYIDLKMYNIIPLEIKHSNYFKILKKKLHWLLQEQSIDKLITNA